MTFSTSVLELPCSMPRSLVKPVLSSLFAVTRLSVRVWYQIAILRQIPVSTINFSLPDPFFRSTMDGKISLAWAIQFDHAQLAARLEAYVETKAPIRTLIACLSRLELPSKRQIPGEVMLVIAGALEDAVYRPKIRRWTRARKCYQGECKTLDHFTRGELDGFDWIDRVHPRKIDDYMGEEAYDKHQETLNKIDDYMGEEAYDKHQETLNTYLRKISSSVSDRVVSRFARCKEVGPIARNQS